MGQDGAKTYESLAGTLEYLLLDGALTDDEIGAACQTAEGLGIGAVIVRPSDLDQALRHLSGSSVRVGSVAGWPDGSSTTAVKLYEGRDLLRRGAKQLEFVLNAGKTRSRQFQYVETELMQITKSCREEGIACTINLRSDLLSEDLRIIVTKICRRVEADGIGVEASDAAVFQPLLREVLQLKCAGGVNGLEDALAAQAAGCTRLQTTDPAAICTAWKAYLESQTIENGVIS